MTESHPPQLHIERVFDAPRALVFAQWILAEHLGAWFAPAGFDVVDCRVDARPGNAWRVVYRSAAGARWTEHGTFLEVIAPERLRFTLVNENERGEVTLRSEVEITFREQDGRTIMAFSQTGFASDGQRDVIRAGWSACLAKLDQQLASERELRALFSAWFLASERKDLDASMAPIAADVLSYEHEAPLSYQGVEALRATCAVGFARAPETFRWDVPDLRIVVRGDVAITWGLNHMRGPGVEMWSRGTRIFQKIDGRWQMIHQHVSFPMDPATGAVRVDLAPTRP